MHRRPLPRLFCAALSAAWLIPTLAASPPTREFRTATFSIALRSDTQTLASLAPLGEADFDFLPAHLEAQRRGDGYVHLGDLSLRLRSAGGEWRDFSSYRARQPVRALDTDGTLAAADITATLGPDLPLSV